MISRVYNDPRLVGLLLFLVVISGVAGFATRARLEDPRSSTRWGFVTTYVPGATPTDVE
jgi:multidrug efflux pump subunit AcrB